MISDLGDGLELRSFVASITHHNLTIRLTYVVYSTSARSVLSTVKSQSLSLELSVQHSCSAVLRWRGTVCQDEVLKVVLRQYELHSDSQRFSNGDSAFNVKKFRKVGLLKNR